MKFTEIYTGGQVIATWASFDSLADLSGANFDHSIDTESSSGEMRVEMIRLVTIFGQRVAVNPVTISSLIECDSERLPDEVREQVVMPESVV